MHYRNVEPSMGAGATIDGGGARRVRQSSGAVIGGCCSCRRERRHHVCRWVFGNLTVAENVIAGAFGRLRAARPFGVLRACPRLAWIALLGELTIAAVGSLSAAEERRTLLAEARREIDRFGTRLGPRIDQRAFRLSYANRRRIEIARALAARPALLLLDEPAAGMNVTETAELQAQLAELRAGGQAMLLVEHKLDFVRALADRVIVLDGGVKIFDGSSHDFQTDPAVVEAYVNGRDAALVREAYLGSLYL